MTDGVARGDGLGPLLFDSTMRGQLVHVVGSADGRLDSGAVVPVTDDLPLTLVAAPTYTEIDALAEEARSAAGLGQGGVSLRPGILNCHGGLGVRLRPSS